MWQWNFDQEHCVSYLPLSHIAAQVIDIYLCFYGGATVWFADKTALQGSLIDTLLEVRPTRFIGVPRVYEKIHEKLLEVGKQNKGLSKLVSNWAKRQAFLHHQSRMAGSDKTTLQYLLAKKLLSKVTQCCVLCKLQYHQNIVRFTRGSELTGRLTPASAASSPGHPRCR